MRHPAFIRIDRHADLLERRARQIREVIPVARCGADEALHAIADQDLLEARILRGDGRAVGRQ